jgi:hypothetical protein
VCVQYAPEVCTRCAEQCERFADDEWMKVCATACRTLCRVLPDDVGNAGGQRECVAAP